MKRLFILIALVSALAIAGDTMGRGPGGGGGGRGGGGGSRGFSGGGGGGRSLGGGGAHALVRRRRKPALDVVRAPFESAFLHSAKPAGYGRIATCESTERQSEQSAKLGCE